MKPKKLGIIGGSLLAFGILICAIAFPPFLRSQVKKVSEKKNKEISFDYNNITQFINNYEVNWFTLMVEI